jgi:Leucine-rich repeat (LRR) protein
MTMINLIIDSFKDNVLFLFQNIVNLELKYKKFTKCDDIIETIELCSRHLNFHNIILVLDSIDLNEFVSKIKNKEALMLKSKLGVLHVKYIKIQTLNSGKFSEFRNLRELRLNDIHITVIKSKTFIDMKSLLKLDLSHNQIRYLNKNQFLGLENLEELYLFDNRITNIEPNVFSSLSNLKILFLCFNQIESLQANFFNGLFNLQILNLNSNKISFIEKKCFKSLNKLKKLEMSENQLKTLNQEQFNGLDLCLEKLDLTNNKFTTIKGSVLAKMSHLRTLKLDRYVVVLKK